MIIPTSTTDIVLDEKPEEIVLQAPTLEQISTLVQLGYEPPHLEHYEGEFVMTLAKFPIHFPVPELVRKVMHRIGLGAKERSEAFQGLFAQEEDNLIRYEFFTEGEEDQYSVHTKVLEMEARAAMNAYYDRLAEELENGMMYQCQPLPTYPAS